MIEWLIQTTAAHPDLGRAAPPAGLLAPEEQERFAALRTSKRRQDWLLGRWTAKHLLQRVLGRQLGRAVSLDAMVVRSAPSGAPEPLLLDPSSRAAALPVSLSITHRDDAAACAVSWVTGARLGVDLETIEPRSGRFVADYFTHAERALVDAAGRAERDVIANAVWSCKEAVLKALGLGLTVDTRRVCCLPELGTDHAVWRPVVIDGDRALLPARALRGWWRQQDRQVLSMAAGVLSAGSRAHRAPS